MANSICTKRVQLATSYTIRCGSNSDNVANFLKRVF